MRYNAGGASSGEWTGGERTGHSVTRSLKLEKATVFEPASTTHGQPAKVSGTTYYWQFDHGKPIHVALEFQDGRCAFDGDPCDTADVRFAALKTVALLAEVRLRWEGWAESFAEFVWPIACHTMRASLR